MPVGFGGATLADACEGALQRVLILHEDDAQPPSGLAVDDPLRPDPCLLERGHDLVQDVRDAGLEILLRLVLEIGDLCSHAAILARIRGGLDPTIKLTRARADVRRMRLTLAAAFSIAAQSPGGQVRAQVWKLQDALSR